MINMEPKNLNEPQNSELNIPDVILPCPFCGGDAERILRGNAHTKKRSAEIKCKECGVLMVVGTIRNNLDWCDAIVTSKWNRRAEGKEQYAQEVVKNSSVLANVSGQYCACHQSHCSMINGTYICQTCNKPLSK